MKRQTSGDKVAAALAGGTAEIANAVKGTLRTKLFVATFTAFVGAFATYLFRGHSSADSAPSIRMSVIQQVGTAPAQSPAQTGGTQGAIKSAADAVSAGNRYVERGDYASALDAFKQATATDPSNSYAWANLGAAAAKLGRATEAVQAYDHALAVEPENWLAHYNLGCQLLRLGKRDEAFDHISRGVRLARRQARTPAERKTTLDKLRYDDTTRELRNDPRFDALFAAE